MPPTVRAVAPDCVIVPVVAVASKLPPTPEVAKIIPMVFTIVALPVKPVVLKAIVPVAASVPRSISSLAVVVVKLEVPEAVMTPESVMEPALVSIMRLPPKVVVTVPKSRAIAAFVREMFPVAPLVLMETAPVYEDIWSRVISSLAVGVVKLEVPPTVSTPLSVIDPPAIMAQVEVVVMAAISIPSASVKASAPAARVTPSAAYE